MVGSTPESPSGSPSPLPETFSHRGQSYVNFHDQGRYGCCSSVAVVNLVESVIHRFHKKDVRLSVQELYDYGHKNTILDLKLVLVNGLMYKEDYPMIGPRLNQDLMRPRPIPGVKRCKITSDIISSFEVFDDEETLKTCIHVQPILMVTNDWSKSTMNAFKKITNLDVFHLPQDESPDDEALPPGHTMLVEGYGIDDNGEAYWEVLNSWGEWWGDKGYACISINVPIFGIVPIYRWDYSEWESDGDIEEECEMEKHQSVYEI